MERGLPLDISKRSLLKVLKANKDQLQNSRSHYVFDFGQSLDSDDEINFSEIHPSLIPNSDLSKQDPKNQTIPFSLDRQKILESIPRIEIENKNALFEHWKKNSFKIDEDDFQKKKCNGISLLQVFWANFHMFCDKNLTKCVTDYSWQKDCVIFGSEQNKFLTEVKKSYPHLRLVACFCPECKKVRFFDTSFKGIEKCGECEQKTNVFYYFPLTTFLKMKIEEPNFFEIIDFDLKKKENGYSDFQDGESFQKLIPFIPKDCIPIIFSFNNDAIDTADVATDNLNVFFLQIMNYPRFSRCKPENCALLALKRVNFGEDADFSPIIKCMVEELLHFDEPLKQPLKGKTRVKTFLLNGVFDLKARPKILNCKDINGYYGNIFSHQPGRRSKGRRCHIFPKPHLAIGRSAETMLSDVANQKNGFENFVPTQLWFLPYFNIIYFTTIDLMHNCLEGIFKDVINFGLKKGLVTEEDVCAICKYLRLIKPPLNFGRELFRIKGAKAIEVLFILLYCPKLFAFVDSRLFEIIMILSEIVRTLHQSFVSDKDCNSVDEMIKSFCEKCDSLFGDRFMIPNMAAFAFLGKDCRKHGPAYTHSTFVYEGHNHRVMMSINTPENYEDIVINNWNNRLFLQNKMENNPIIQKCREKRHTFKNNNIIIRGFKFGTKKSKFLSTASLHDGTIVDIIKRDENSSLLVQPLTNHGFPKGAPETVEETRIAKPLLMTFEVESTHLPLKKYQKKCQHAYSAGKYFVDLHNISDMY